MFLTLMTFLSGKFGKYAIIAAAVVALLAASFGYIKLKEHEATQAALLNFNIQQLEQAQKENTAYQAKIVDLQKFADDLTKKLNASNASVDKGTESTVQFIDRQKSRKVDPLFNSTLKRMKGLK